MQENDLFYTIPPEQREQKRQQVQQTDIFLQFIEERPYEEQKSLFKEIDDILDKGMPLLEFLQTGFKDGEIDRNDFRKIATLCFVETLMDFVAENRIRTEDLHSNPGFSKTYEAVLRRIAHYINGVTDEFPREAVRCLFLLTDEDIDPHRQGLTATQLTLHSFYFCKTDEQKTEIERLIKDCIIQPE